MVAHLLLLMANRGSALVTPLKAFRIPVRRHSIWLVQSDSCWATVGAVGPAIGRVEVVLCWRMDVMKSSSAEFAVL